jgi:hypothetical protein
MYDALGPLEGVRMWQHVDGRLLALNFKEWHPIPKAAMCRRGEDHPVPDMGCSCGYYAAADVDTFLEWQPRTQFWAGRYVIGPVKGWGRAIKYTQGWRAEYARPLGFFELTVPPVPRDRPTGVIRGAPGTVPLIVWRRREPSPLIDLAERWGVPRLLPPLGVREFVWQREPMMEKQEA